MTFDVAKSILEDEIVNNSYENRKPYDSAYSRRKIITYLWACHKINMDKGDMMDSLNNLFRDVNMTEDEIRTFILNSELVIETIKRNSLEK